MSRAPRELHLDRERASSFGSVAEQYDRYRLTYPPDLIDDLAGLRPANVLDVGCGTGKVAAALAERGLSVVGVEVDERMARVARRRGVEVEVAAFESWDSAGRAFDLVTSGDAWHWIDPVRGAARAAEVLHTGGTIARFWTSTAVDEATSVAFERVYRAHAPDVAQVWRPGTTLPRTYASGADAFERSPAFSAVETRSYRWEHSFAGEEWVGLAGTVSDHQRLGTERLAALLRALRGSIEDLGGTVHTHHETYVLLARRL